jgi:hypothetical protein
MSLMKAKQILQKSTAVFGIALASFSGFSSFNVEAAAGTINIVTPSGLTSNNELVCITPGTNAPYPTSTDIQTNMPVFDFPIEEGNYTVFIFEDPTNAGCGGVGTANSTILGFIDSVNIAAGEITTLNFYSSNSGVPESAITTELDSTRYFDTSYPACGVEVDINDGVYCDFNLTNGTNFVTSGGGIHQMRLRNVQTGNVYDANLTTGNGVCSPVNLGIAYPCSYDLSGDLPAGLYEVFLNFGDANFQFISQVSIVDFSEMQIPEVTCDDSTLKAGQVVTCSVALSDQLTLSEKQSMANFFKIGVDDVSYITNNGYYNEQFDEKPGDCYLTKNNTTLECKFKFGSKRKPGTYEMYIGVPSSDSGIEDTFGLTLLKSTKSLSTIRTGGSDY